MGRFEISVPQGVIARQPAPFPVPGASRPRKVGTSSSNLLIERRSLTPEEVAIEELRALVRNMSSASKHIKSARASQSSLLDLPDEVLRRALKTKGNAKLFKSVCAERNKLAKPLDKLASALDRLVESLQLRDDAENPAED